MGATLWLLLVATGVGLMWAMRYTTIGWLDAVLIRASASSFVGAGIVGAGGWVGDLISGLVGAVTKFGGQIGMAGLGTGAVWVVWLGLCGMWVLTMLPETWFAKPIPDWLVFAGAFLPSVAGAIPGPLGDGLERVITTLGQLMVNAVRSAFGM